MASRSETDLSDFDDQVDEDICRVATRLSRQTTTFDEQNIFAPATGGKLDPSSSNFEPRLWLKTLHEVFIRPPDSPAPRKTGVAFHNLGVHGYGGEMDYQKTVSSSILQVFTSLRGAMTHQKQKINILHNMNGVLHAGETLAVLGPPGSGCSTFLRTLAGETHGLHVSADAYINYRGISSDAMHTNFRGEAVYTAEVDHHLPTLSVGDTLYFAARARAPSTLPPGITLHQYAVIARDAAMAMLGISHTVNTQVGDDFVRGVSGGERKRVTIAEAALGGAPLSCWDNSTRGLDSANSIAFCKSIKLQAEVLGVASCIAIYQAPEAAYESFDKVTVLYEGYQIFFGPTDEAKAYFESLGFVCPDRQTTPDFLTSMTNPNERVIRAGLENQVPRSAESFARAWEESQQYQRLMQQIESYKTDFPFGGNHHKEFLESRRSDQAKGQRIKSPFNLSYLGQIQLCLWRELRCLLNNPSVVISSLLMYFGEALVIGSIFYNLQPVTASFSKRDVLLFYALLLNAFACIGEIFTLYGSRKVVEKQARYAFYHPSADALANILASLPHKILNCIAVNLPLYFMSHLRREPGAFFTYLLFSFLMVLSMSMFFRFTAAVSTTLAQALAPASIILLAIIVFSGFAIPQQYMLGWIRWFHYINPTYWGFESLMVNEFSGRTFECSTFVPSGPGYDVVADDERVCSVAGSTPGSGYVSGEAFIAESYNFHSSHKWVNMAYVIAITAVLCIGYILATEFNPGERSKGEVIMFPRKNLRRKIKPTSDIENGRPLASTHQTFDDSQPVPTGVQRQESVFHWEKVSYDIKIKGEPRKILDQVDGWVKPGTMTALMGVSGAGKTTLLDVLANRVTMGVITGDMLVNGKDRGTSFQQKTGYVQQQDLHLATSTVREALTFSALLRQPDHIPQKERIDYVATVIDLLDMHTYADAIVGIPGEGLNVEQRKRLSIGVELASRPQLLLFLDEPTSGLDSQTSWSICSLMEKLARSGQAILCTIHQPSAMLFQRFDRLLLLAKGGRTVYFGNIGPNAETLLGYFARHNAPLCPPEANPAEYMLQVIQTDIDWPAIWRQSVEFQEVQDELQRLKQSRNKDADECGADVGREYAAPFYTQCFLVTWRVFQQYWRTPSYIYSKILLSAGTALFLGFSFFKAPLTEQGLRNQMFGIFLFLTVSLQMVMQIVPIFVLQRTLYEARERPSKIYSWQSFLFANMTVELAWNTVMGILCFVAWYYPIGLYHNAEPTDAVHSRGTLAFLFIWVLMLFTSTLAHLLIAGIERADAASGLATILYELLLLFCGVLAGPEALPGFWIFMYRVNPFTYLVDGLLSTSLANTKVTCSADEYLNFNAPASSTCAQYLSSYISTHDGYLLDPDDTTLGGQCQYCTVGDTNAFLSAVNSHFNLRWRNFGLMWVFVVFNIIGAVGIYWLVRVPRKKISVK